MCTVLPYDASMNIRSVKHRGLRRLIEDDDGRGIRQDLLDRVRKILAVLIVAPDMRSCCKIPHVNRFNNSRIMLIWIIAALFTVNLS
jgi:hypothetical protein